MAGVAETPNGETTTHDLKSLLSSEGRDFLIRNNGDQVRIADLLGKTVALYFSASWCGPCRRFTPTFVEVYEELYTKGDFEVVFVSADKDEESFREYFSKMPWLAVPLSDSEIRDRLNKLFQVRGIPNLVILDGNGKVLSDHGVQLIRDYGVEAYPFTPERIKEIKEEEEAARRNQSLSTLLATQSRDYLISSNGNQVLVSELVGKNILFYFSAHWCPPCRAFLPKLIKAYHEIKARDDAFEIIFISSDLDQNSFDEFFSSMPWLALPFGDERKKSLGRTFKIYSIPTLVAIGPTGKTVTKDARGLLTVHGPDAYPFTEEHLKAMEAKIEEMAKDWPKNVKHTLHAEHELKLERRKGYNCDGCREEGRSWSYYCKECDFDLHPKCALEEDKREDNEKGETEGGVAHEEAAKEAWVCDGDVCHKA